AKVRRMSYGGSGSITFDWQSSTTDVHIGALSAGIDPSGNISLLWVSSESTPKLYLTVLGNTGTVLRTPFVLTDTDAALPTNPAVAVGEHGYVSATWVDRRPGKRAVYYQILDNSYQLIDVNQPVSSSSPEVMKTPAISAQYGRAWFAWADSRSDGFNIYANNLVYLPTDANGGENNLPESFSLGQNYPNPFNPTTEIFFTLSARARVSLVLYNMLGQQVRTLVDATLPVGRHSVNWDGKDYSGKQVASGVYLYRLVAGDKTQTKKMELLK
ncbi:MAG TPA: T9SS type A sorting domain-containing protein, partial [candidate division Zixibacteria bacterium]|nr:T9SS type A sorting domain-containing protein [candidate division Zixibacteria bacterium]